MRVQGFEGLGPRVLPEADLVCNSSKISDYVEGLGFRGKGSYCQKDCRRCWPFATKNSVDAHVNKKRPWQCLEENALQTAACKCADAGPRHPKTRMFQRKLRVKHSEQDLGSLSFRV